MDITTAIVAILFLAICIVPMAIINRKGKKDNQENKDKQ